MSIIDHIIGLIETRVELIKLEVKEESSFVLSRLVLGLIMGLFLFFSWLFLAMGFGLLLNWLLESKFWGIVIIGGIHLLIFILLFIFRHKLGLDNYIHRMMDEMFDKEKRTDE